MLELLISSRVFLVGLNFRVLWTTFSIAFLHGLSNLNFLKRKYWDAMTLFDRVMIFSQMSNSSLIHPIRSHWRNDILPLCPHKRSVLSKRVSQTKLPIFIFVKVVFSHLLSFYLHFSLSIFTFFFLSRDISTPITYTILFYFKMCAILK